VARHWTFDWDPEKAAINRRKHRVSFEEAATVFYDPDAVFLPDPENEVILGYTLSSRLLYTVFVEIEGDVIRIISARLATPLERKQYEENA
jgi:uncharacterized DUF497 family protein